jgi:hypothetical protein
MIVPEDRYKILEEKAWTAINNSTTGAAAIKALIKGMSRQQKEAFELGMLAKSYSMENIVRGIAVS